MLKSVKTTRVTVAIHEDLIESLKHLGYAEGKSKSQVLNEALKMYIFLKERSNLGDKILRETPRGKTYEIIFRD